VATQHNVLRTKFFIGLPEMVMNYFKFVAQECREIMAAMGVRSIAELIGHTELLEILRAKPRSSASSTCSRCWRIPAWCRASRSFAWIAQRAVRQGRAAEQMLRDMSDAIQNKSGGEFSYEVRNFHRSIGARISVRSRSAGAIPA